MTKRHLLIVFVIVGFNLLAFQNCGQVASSQRASSSTSGSGGNNNGLTVPPEFKPKEVIIRMKDTAANELLNQYLAAAGGVTIENFWPDTMLSHWKWDGPMDFEQFKSFLSADEALALDMLYIEHNFVYHESVNYTLNQVLAFPPNQQTQTQVDIKQSELWTSLTPGKAKPIIAVIDTGINLTHNTFVQSGALWRNTGEIAGDGLDNDGNGFIDDVNGYNFRDKNGDIDDKGGHGTHCAGIILGVGQNIFKQPAVDPAKIQIMALKFIGTDGGSTSDAINAIMYAVKNGAKVISNSWGGPTDSKALEDAIKFAYSKEVVFVAAAGNSAVNIDSTPTYPASYRLPNVISVAATDSSDQLASFSNFGTGSVNMGAPGVSILSTYPPNEFSYLSGTSMATPFVAGTAILQIYERPSLYSYQLKNIILQKADSAAGLNGKVATPVRLNSNAAVQESKVVALSTEHPEVSPPSSGGGGAAAQDEGKKGGCGAVVKVGGNFPPSSPPWAVIASLMLPIIVALKLRSSAVRV